MRSDDEVSVRSRTLCELDRNHQEPRKLIKHGKVQLNRGKAPLGKPNLGRLNQRKFLVPLKVSCWACKSELGNSSALFCGACGKKQVGSEAGLGFASESHFHEDLVNTTGISKVSFYNKADESMVFKVNLVGTSKNQVRVANLLTAFKADLVILEDGSILEQDEEGFSVDTFNAGASFGITIVAQKHKNSEILEASSSHTGKFFYYQLFCSITFCFHYKNSKVCILQMLTFFCVKISKTNLKRN